VLRWLIIGGGIHGTHLAIALVKRFGVARRRLRVLDPYGTPLASWQECCERVGMPFLRSPAVHNIGAGPYELLDFARWTGSEKDSRFAAPYARPSRILFNAHCRHVIAQSRIDRLFVRGTAHAVHVRGDRVLVETDRGSIEAERVVLALGARQRPRWPEWAKALRQEGGEIQHVFDDDARIAGHESRGPVAVVGGGLSAVQVALRLAREREDHVILLSRSALRVHQFDADPGWLGPKYLDDFERTTSLATRRKLITDARRTGSVPPDAHFGVQEAIDEGRIHAEVAEVRAARLDTDGTTRLGTDQGPLTARRVLLATGFDSRRPGGEVVDSLVEECGLPIAECGYPIVDGALRWQERVFVMGPLAELEIGPVSRNISGARKAAERIGRVA